jgi:hypothetical protein
VQGSGDDHLVAGASHRHHGCVVGAGGAIYPKAAKICTPELGSQCFGLKDQGWTNSIWMVTWQNWNVTVDYRTG